MHRKMPSYKVNIPCQSRPFVGSIGLVEYRKTNWSVEALTLHDAQATHNHKSQPRVPHARKRGEIAAPYPDYACRNRHRGYCQARNAPDPEAPSRCAPAGACSWLRSLSRAAPVLSVAGGRVWSGLQKAAPARRKGKGTKEGKYLATRQAARARVCVPVSSSVEY